MRYVIDVAERKDAVVEIVTDLLHRKAEKRAEHITILYPDTSYLQYVEKELLYDFGEPILEAGWVQFLPKKTYRSNGSDQLITPEKKDN